MVTTRKAELSFRFVARNSFTNMVQNVTKPLEFAFGKARNSRVSKTVTKTKPTNAICMLLNPLETVLLIDCVTVLTNGLKNVRCRTPILGNRAPVSTVKFVEKLTNELKAVRQSRSSS